MDRRTFMLAGSAALVGGCVSVPGVAGPPAPAPVFRVGDRWVYNCSDGFRVPVTLGRDARGHGDRRAGHRRARHAARRHDELHAHRAAALAGRRERGRGLRSRGDAAVRAAARPLPVPADARARRGRRTCATATRRTSSSARSTASSASAAGEKVTVPAGTFDAIVMRILMSVDDNNPFRWPTERQLRRLVVGEGRARRCARRSTRRTASAATAATRSRSARRTRRSSWRRSRAQAPSGAVCAPAPPARPACAAARDWRCATPRRARGAATRASPPGFRAPRRAGDSTT